MSERAASPTTIYKFAFRENKEVETNKTLMSITPLAIWGSKLESLDELYVAVQLYCSLTIPHELPVTSCYLYCYAIKIIIHRDESKMTKE
jgi:ADP-ribosylglycohydrolase